MRHTLKLLSAFLKVNLQQDLAYRSETVLNILINLFWLGWELLSLQIIFSNTTQLSGWGLGELIALLGVWRMANMMMSAVIWPNTNLFNDNIRSGSFDYALLQPVHSQFLVSFSRVLIWRVWEMGLAIALITIGIHMSKGLVSAGSLLSFVILLASGMAVLYSLWIVLISFTFYFVKFDNNITILHALMDAGRYPATIYPPWLRIIITFVIPVAVATTVPLQALRGELAWWQVIIFLCVGALSLAIAARVWQAGVRKYSSASS